MSDPSGALSRMQDRGHGAFPRLLACREFTAARMVQRREQLADISCPSHVSVVLFGSWARQELTAESDDDWAVLVESGEASDPAVKAVEDAAREIFGQGDRKPGAQDIFGTSFTCEDLVRQIGLEDDSNRLLTRRMLLLLESVAVVGAGAHRRCWERVLTTYLDRGAKSFRPPRFLLNDVVRYWRTMCVDFEGKHWGDHARDPKWVTRNAKLRTSRKVLFGAGLIPLLACHAVPRDEQFDFLARQLAAVPTDRLAEAFMTVDGGLATDTGARGLQAYDRFVDLMAHSEVRDELLALTADSRIDSRLWLDVKSLGDELQQSLLALLFGPTLSSFTRQYAMF